MDASGRSADQIKMQFQNGGLYNGGTREVNPSK
jgi:hypothetical protein